MCHGIDMMLFRCWFLLNVCQMNKYHPQGHSKLEAEEVLYNQRLEGGFPFVILRLPDIVGPRDTTSRWWLYHLWVRLSAVDPTRPIQTPRFLSEYAISLVYSEDVAAVIANMTMFGRQIEDQVGSNVVQKGSDYNSVKVF